MNDFAYRKSLKTHYKTLRANKWVQQIYKIQDQYVKSILYLYTWNELSKMKLIPFSTASKKK